MIRFEEWREFFPPTSGGAYDVVPRVIRTPFVDEWRGRRDEGGRAAEWLRGEVMAALREGRAHELVPFTGQTAGLIRELLPAAEIVRRIVAEAEGALDERERSRDGGEVLARSRGLLRSKRTQTPCRADPAAPGAAIPWCSGIRRPPSGLRRVETQARLPGAIILGLVRETTPPVEGHAAA